MQLHSVAFWVIVSLIGLLVVSIIKNSLYMLGAEQRMAAASQKVQSLEKQQHSLLQNQQALRSTAYIEQQIRNKLKLVKPGESLVVLPSTLQEKTEEEAYKYQVTEENISLKQTNWQRWLHLFL